MTIQIGGPPHVIPGDLLIVNSTVVNTDRIGDPTGVSITSDPGPPGLANAAPANNDRLKIYSAVQIGTPGSGAGDADATVTGFPVAAQNRRFSVYGPVLLAGPITFLKGAADTITIDGRTTAHTGVSDLIVQETRGAVAGEQRAVFLDYSSGGVLPAAGTGAPLVCSITDGAADNAASYLTGLIFKATSDAGPSFKTAIAIENAARWDNALLIDVDNTLDIGLAAVGGPYGTRSRPRNVHVGTSVVVGATTTITTNSITGSVASTWGVEDATLTIRTIRNTDGAGDNLSISAANGRAVAAGAANGASLSITSGNAAVFGALTAVGGNISITTGNGADGAAGAGNAGNMAFLGGTPAGIGTGGSLTFTGGPSAGAGSTAGGITLITGASTGAAGSVAGSLLINVGAQGALGTKGTIGIGNLANSGTIQIGNAGSASAVNIDANAASTIRVTGSTMLVETTGANNIRLNSGSNVRLDAAGGSILTSATTFASDAALAVTTGGATDLTLNPGGARNLVSINGKGITNARFEATQLHLSDDFDQAALGSSWSTTIVGAGAGVAMDVTADGVADLAAPGQVNGTVRLSSGAIAGGAPSSAILRRGGHRLVNRSQSPIYEWRIALSAITQTRLFVGLFNGAVAFVYPPAGGSANDGTGINPAAGSNWVGFEFIAAAGPATLRARYNAGAGVVDADAIAAPVAGTMIGLRIEITAAGVATFYTSTAPGVWTLRATTAAAITALNMEPLVFIDNNNNAANVDAVGDYVKVFQAAR